MWEIKSCSKSDDCYPKHLRKIASAPERLYYVGDISLCDNVVIAVIGKRDAAQRYLQIARKIGEVLAREGCTVLNGLAIGCDTEALEGAVAEQGKVVAVMPGGLDEIYPKSNKRLAEKILENGGCLISEYPSGVKPQKYMFVQRDRIQAMLSNKVFVVDSETDGGTMHTAEYALKFSRPLGCFSESSSTEDKTPAGNRFLIESNKATAVQDTEGLLKFLEEPEYQQMSLFG